MQIRAQKKYAELIAKKGVHIKRGQRVVIYCETDCPQFAEYLTEACYRAGASEVRVEWSYQPLTALHVKYQKTETLGKVEAWEVEKLRLRTETLPARIHLLSEDPDGLRHIDAQKYAEAQKLRYPVIKPFRDAVENREQWCIAAVPGKKWAKKVFPGERESRAVELLWQAILHASRADGPDPCGAWEEHNRALRQKYEYLNALGIESLHYTAENGTDITVGLLENGVFAGGEEKTLSGRSFNPNIPSEEVFTTPKRGMAEGKAVISKPYSYRGVLIDGIVLEFHEGRVVSCSAQTNGEVLSQMLEMDEGASYLGECALVPYHSPISESGILYYNTLFDENAACHIALGMGFADCVRDYGNYSLAQIREMGVNDSMIHEDLMIGTADLCITAHTRDGRDVPVFVDGDWAF